MLSNHSKQECSRRIRRRALQMVFPWLLLASLPVSGEAGWLLVEFSPSRPSCSESSTTTSTTGSRCIGTRSQITRFEMRDGELLTLPVAADLPPAWVGLSDLWLYAPAAGGQQLQRSIELSATPIGARLIIQDQHRSYVRSVELDQWQELRSDSNEKLWVRVSRTSSGEPALPQP